MGNFLTPELLKLYEIEDRKYLPDVNAEGILLRHKKSGAGIVLLPNDDNNKVFYIAFRTPPEDSTGVAHIIEHTVLCGSKDFPVKDPFIELVKGSLNTFLNAMTYPDKTVYPVASCNETDFKNLMHVYLDAVLYPNIYREKRIFEQEGWHYEVDDDGEITVNGVVYNEMKGALSSPDDILSREIYSTLFPDTPYAHESGGDPLNIPDLTYEYYLDFHRRYYHPCNSYIYLYGDMDMAERLEYLDREYLSKFEKIEIDSEIPVQSAFDIPREYVKQYSIMEDEETEGKSYLSWNTVLSDGKLPLKELTAMKVIDYAISDAEGAPLTKALRDAGIGEDVYSMFETSLRQPSYSVISKYADTEQKEQFVSVIEDTLRAIIENGFDERSLLAGINYYEFRYRESDFGSYPRGLIFGLSALDTWLYDKTDPWMNLDIGDTFRELKSEIGTGYFEELIRRYLLENTHRSLLMLEPEKGLDDKRAKELKDKLKKMSDAMTEEDREVIKENFRLLREWQETPDSPEDVEKIPMLSRDELTDYVEPYSNVYSEEDGIRRLYHPIFCNRIHYLTFLFDLKDLPEDLFPYLSIFKTVFGAVDTKNFGYAELNKEIDIMTGGISQSISTYTSYEDSNKFKNYFEVHVKVLHDNLEKAFSLVSEILMNSVYTDMKRLHEILEEERAGARADLVQSGHLTAAGRAMSYISPAGKILEEISGISAYRKLDEVCTMLEGDDNSAEKEQLAEILARISEAVFARDNLLIDCTAEEKDLEEMRGLEKSFVDALPEKHVTGTAYVPVLKPLNEGFYAPGQVQYVCRAGNFMRKGHSYSAAFKVLRVIMGYDYLWSKVRVTGGAYGCMSSYTRDGYIYFVSYRDPHLKQTVETFEGAADFVASFEADERTMTKYIIGTVSGMDHPMTAAQKGRFSRSGFLTGVPEEVIRNEKRAVINAAPEDIRALADAVRAAMTDSVICVVGSEEKVKGAPDLFGAVKKLI